MVTMNCVTSVKASMRSLIKCITRLKKWQKTQKSWRRWPLVCRSART
ncbi:Uncharacterised protein [Vibrio cholerae]|nr:Uncharacterised protein [Vibrio cholerae]